MAPVYGKDVIAPAMQPTSGCWRRPPASAPEVFPGERGSFASGATGGGDDDVMASGKNSIVYSAAPLAGTWQRIKKASRWDATIF